MDNVKSSSRSEDEDEELHSTDPESKEKGKDKKSLCKVKWSRDEDEKLKKSVEQNGTDSWKVISSYLPGRTDGQCQHRWQKVLNPELVKGPWTKEEDQKVIDLVHKYGPKRWSVIAKHLQGRIGKQCRERWHNHLNPEVKKSSWTQEEDHIIYEAHKRLGNRWAEISKLLPGRTDNSIKNHWNSTMRRKVEHEGYLQEGLRAFSSSHCVVKRRHHRPCPPPPPENLHCDHSPLSMSAPNQMQGYPYDPHNGHLMDSLADTSCFLSSMEQYSVWSDSASDDTLTTSNSSLEEQGEGRCSRGPPVPQGPPGQLHISPSKFLAVETGTFLSTLQTIPEFAETMELIDSICMALQDPVAWSDVASFELSEAATPPKHTQQEYAALLQERTMEALGYTLNNTPSSTIPAHEKQCAPFGPGRGNPLTPISTSSKASPQPSNGRRKRREKGGQSSPMRDRNYPSFLENVTNSPKKTPIKSMPFSPSQVFNVSGAEHLGLEHPAFTSTPVCGQKCLLNTPLQKETTPKQQKENAGSRTPKFRKAVMMPTPRTPTPFKNALAAQEKMHGPLKMEPQSLAFLEEDIREVLKRETGADIFNRADIQHEFRTWKHDMDGPARKVRKSLMLDPVGKDCLNVQLFQERLNAEEADENLLTSSFLMTPIPEQEERSRPLSSGSEEVVPLHRLPSPRGKKTPATHGTPTHNPSVQVHRGMIFDVNNR